jgi:hypothetical protein
MKNENLDSKGQFKMRMDEEEAEASPISNQVDDLRIEKLSHRMTLVTILIPVLIVIVLAIAYMDIKKRVIQTEDTGQLTAESLSKELESRFETLTMTQKAVDENVARLKEQSDKSMAKIQINLKKLDDKLAGTSKRMTSQKEFKAANNKLGRNVANVAQSIEELKLQVDRINTTFQAQIASLESALVENKGRMAQLDDQLAVLDTQKIDKEKLGLALKLEMIKIKQQLKAQLEELQSRLTSLEKRAAQPAASPTPAEKTPSPPEPASTTPTTAPLSPSPGELEEQNLGK